MRYGFVIDTRRCIGCHTCSIACRKENNLPDGNWWNRVLTDGGDQMDTPEGLFPNVRMNYVALNCQHCDDPACVKVCPVGATYKDPETGAVRQDYDKCIGCRMCMAACPYTGVRNFNWDEPKYSIDLKTGSADAPAHVKHTVEKCTMCYHRIVDGKNPACVDICPARARFWGDFEDPNSDVSRLIAEHETKKILPEMGTSPSAYYIV